MAANMDNGQKIGSRSMTRAKIGFDVVMPAGNENEFISRARALGYSEIVFLYADEKRSRAIDGLSCIAGMTIKKAFLARNTSEIAKARNRFDYVFAPAERVFFESDADFIIDAESGGKDSLHFRSTRLNQVHAELAKKNDMTIVFSFSNLISNPAVSKGKMKQNAQLVMKYRLKHAVFSMAKDPLMMRSRAVLDALGATLGL